MTRWQSGLLRCRPALAVLFIAGTACSGTGNPAEPDRVPTIEIAGVQDGEVRSGPATITITVDVGTYAATLNGAAFWSGRTVSQPGSYLLIVTARNGTANATVELRFEITPEGETRLIVRLFDLGANDAGGGGDAILITDSSSTGSRHVLVDAGPSGAGGADAGFVSRRLADLGIDTLEAVILTHAHTDHFDGMPAVLQSLVVQRFIYNGQQRTFSRYNDVIAQATGRADTVIVPGQLTELEIGAGAVSTRLAILPPLATFLTKSDAESSELNDGSLGTEVSKGPFRMLLTGDGEVLANERWRVQFPARTGGVDILKLGHHWANDATFDNGFNGASSWLAHTAPEVTVSSSNGTSHPRQNAVAYVLSLLGVSAYCTNVHGDIEIRVGEAGTFSVSVGRNAGAVCVAGSQATT